MSTAQQELIPVNELESYFSIKAKGVVSVNGNYTRNRFIRWPSCSIKTR